MSTDGGTIKFGMTTDSTRAERAYLRMQTRVEKLEAANRKLAQQSKKAAKDTESGWTSAFSRALKMVTIYQTMSTVIGTVRNDIRSLAEEQKRGLNLSRSIGQVDLRLSNAFGFGDLKQKRGFLDKVNKTLGEEVRLYTELEFKDLLVSMTQRTTLGTTRQRGRTALEFGQFADAFAGEKENAGEAMAASIAIGRGFGFTPSLPAAQREDIAAKATAFSVKSLSVTSIKEASDLIELNKALSVGHAIDKSDDALTDPVKKLEARMKTAIDVLGIFTAFNATGSSPAEAATAASAYLQALEETIPSKDVQIAGKRFFGFKTLDGQAAVSIAQKEQVMREGGVDSRGRTFTSEQISNLMLFGEKGRPKSANFRAKLKGTASELILGGENLASFLSRDVRDSFDVKELSKEFLNQAISDNQNLSVHTQNFAIQQKLRQNVDDFRVGQGTDNQRTAALRAFLTDPETGVLPVLRNKFGESIPEGVDKLKFEAAFDKAGTTRQIMRDRFNAASQRPEEQEFLRRQWEVMLEIERNTKGIGAAGASAAANARGQTEGK